MTKESSATVCNPKNCHFGHYPPLMNAYENANARHRALRFVLGRHGPLRAGIRLSDRTSIRL